MTFCPFFVKVNFSAFEVRVLAIGYRSLFAFEWDWSNGLVFLDLLWVHVIYFWEY